MTNSDIYTIGSFLYNIFVHNWSGINILPLTQSILSNKTKQNGYANCKAAVSSQEQKRNPNSVNLERSTIKNNKKSMKTMQMTSSMNIEQNSIKHRHQ